MAEDTVTVVARFVAKEGQEAALKVALTNCLAPSRQDAGCLAYSLYASVERPGEFVMVEAWAGRDLLEKHLQTPHLQGLVAKAPELLAEPLSVKLLSELPG
jgi:quinol monooxygenase YgiN